MYGNRTDFCVLIFFRLCWVSAATRGIFILSCGIFPWARGLFRCGLWDTVVAARRPTRSAARRIPVPRPETEPLSPALQGRLYTTGPPGKPLYIDLVFCQLLNIFIYCFNFLHVDFLGFSIRDIMSSANRDRLRLPSPYGCLFTPSSCLNALARTSRTMLNRRGRSMKQHR